MSRSKLPLAQRLQAELHEPEPRGRHDWAHLRTPGSPRTCIRRGCEERWDNGQQEPYGCTGEGSDEEAVPCHHGHDLTGPDGCQGACDA